MRCQICQGQHSADDVCDTLIPLSMPVSTGTAIMGLVSPTPGVAPSAADIAADLIGACAATPARSSSPPVPTPQAMRFEGASSMPFLMSSEDLDAVIGVTVSGYQIRSRLGRGGMGSVYLAENPTSGARVAVKFIHPHLSVDPVLTQRFYAEARAVNLIGHENILNIFDMSVLPPGRFYLVMEFLDGQPLTDLCRGPVDPQIALPILIQACDALSAAHVRGVVHRDLKPDNIFLIRRAGNPHFVKLVDFGIAKLQATEARPDQTSAGAIIGTPDFMSPEQCGGEPVDGRADIYSMGVIAYLLLGGELPFTGKGLVDLLIAHRKDAPKKLTNVSETHWQIISTALAKDPKERYQRAEDMRNALQAALRESKRPGAAPTPQPTTSAAVSPPVVPSIDPPKERRLIPTRRQATYPCSVIRHDSGTRTQAVVSDLSSGGAFVQCGSAPPAAFSRVSVELQTGGVFLSLRGEVVRLVTHEQAAAWMMEPGFVVQFVELTNVQRDAVRQLLAGLPVKADPRTAAATQSGLSSKPS